MKTFWINISIPLIVFVLLLVVAMQTSHGSGPGGLETGQPTRLGWLQDDTVARRA